MLARERAAAEAAAREAEQAARAEAMRAHRHALELAERAHQVRQVVHSGRIRARGNVRFFFIGRDGRTIHRLKTALEVARHLRSGAAAVVSVPDTPEEAYAVVGRQAVEKLDAIAPGLVVFWARERVALDTAELAFSDRDWEPDLRAHRVRGARAAPPRTGA